VVKGGYTKRLIWVDLGTHKVEVRSLEDELLGKFIGGVGIGTKILYEEGLKGKDPFSPDAPLIIMTGPLTGTSVPTSGRLSVVALSPETLSYGESDIGGTWGVGLKRSGFDGLVVKGKSDTPVYLRIAPEEVTIEEATSLWGKDTFETNAALKKQWGGSARVLCIGPAGERLSKIAAIFTDGVHARVAGRGGLGAVMGSKNLKAVVVGGDIRTPVYEADKLRVSVRQSVPEIKGRTRAFSDFGTAGGLLFSEEVGDLPIKNWAWGNWKEGALKISGESLRERMFKKRYSCGACFIGCGRVVEAATPYGVVKGGGPEYETLAAMGSNCLVDDLEAIAVGNELCNRLGLDTISCGSVIGFAMEAFEKGLIAEKDIGYGIPWGDAKATLRLVKDIGLREGFGYLLGEGVKRAAEEIGKGAERFAVHVKGLEATMHDPRAFASLGLTYATNPNGATHWAASYLLEAKFAIPELGYPELLDRFSEEGKPQLVKTMQDYVTMFNSIKMCRFLLRVSPSQIVEWFNLVTGFGHDVQSFLLSGERITNLKRLCNLRLGFGRREDTLPARFIQDKRGTGGAAEYLPNIEDMVSRYYEERKWDDEGIPLPSKMEELGLEEEMKICPSQHPDRKQ
jgi:aldehyde:ferredoxin oxidoreductase